MSGSTHAQEVISFSNLHLVSTQLVSYRSESPFLSPTIPSRALDLDGGSNLSEVIASCVPEVTSSRYVPSPQLSCGQGVGLATYDGSTRP